MMSNRSLDLVLDAMHEYFAVSVMVMSSSSFSYVVDTSVESIDSSKFISFGVSTMLSSLDRSSEDLIPVVVGELISSPGDSPGVDVVGLITVLENCGVPLSEFSAVIQSTNIMELILVREGQCMEFAEIK